MTAPDCAAFQLAAFEAGDRSTLLGQQPHVAAHHEACARCRAWLASFTRGVNEVGESAFAAGVLARTTTGACGRARELGASALDHPLSSIDRDLLSAHLDACVACRFVAEAMTTTARTLPGLADVDPGRSFTAGVLAATSRQPRPGALPGWRRRWEGLVRRPRLAVEAAYAFTLVLVLVTGNPVAAFEWTVARVEPLVERVGVPARVLDASVRALGDRVIGAGGLSGGHLSRGASASPADWVRRAWSDLVRAVSAGLTRLGGALASVASWIEERAFEVMPDRPAATEPGDGPVRSPR
jgi:predicted anti-sigma-YlaC factor YlaD